MQTDDIFYQQKIKHDWTDHNLQVLKHCLEQTEAAISEHTNQTAFPFLATPHFRTVFGIARWAGLDHFLDAATKNLFEQITPVWTKWQGAPILELHGKYTNLTAKHVSSKDEKLTESETGYRKNNHAANQKNQLLFKEIEDPNSAADGIHPDHLVLVHGDGFAYLRIYFNDADFFELPTNIMMLPALDAAPETEFDQKPEIKLHPKKGVAEPEVLPELSLKNTKYDHGQS